jgi:hypothetical protein
MSDRNEGLAADEVGIGFEHPGHKLVGHLWQLRKTVAHWTTTTRERNLPNVVRSRHRTCTRIRKIRMKSASRNRVPKEIKPLKAQLRFCA